MKGTTLVCSRGCANPKRDRAQEHPGICECGGFLDDVPMIPALVYHDIMCPTLTKRGPCTCETQIVVAERTGKDHD
jgi:hypothetical protein